jgi:hypothetical protein
MTGQRPQPIRVTVADFDMPFGSMIVFMLKWALAAIPAMLILIIVGGVVTVVFAGLMAGIVSTAAFRPRSTAPIEESVSGPYSPAFVVTVRPTTDGWSLSSDSTVVWEKCSLSMAGHSVDVPRLPNDRVVDIAASALGSGGIRAGQAIRDRDISISCLSPEHRTARIYLFR